MARFMLDLAVKRLEIEIFDVSLFLFEKAKKGAIQGEKL
jgi:hypothetical protein